MGSGERNVFAIHGGFFRCFAQNYFKTLLVVKMKRINTLSVFFALADCLENMYDVWSDNKSFRRTQSVFQGRYLKYRHVL